MCCGPRKASPVSPGPVLSVDTKPHPRASHLFFDARQPQDVLLGKSRGFPVVSMFLPVFVTCTPHSCMPWVVQAKSVV